MKLEEVKAQIDLLERTATLLYTQTYPVHRQTSYNICKTRKEGEYQLTQLPEVGRSKTHVKPWDEIVALLAVYPGNLPKRKDWRVM